MIKLWETLKKTAVLLLWVLLTGQAANGQISQVRIVNFTVKKQLPAAVDAWNSIPAALILVAQKTQGSRPQGLQLRLQIKQNGSLVCGNANGPGLPVDSFTTRTFSTQELTGLLSNCRSLKAGNYTLCAQFTNADRMTVSEEVCKEFVVGDQPNADIQSFNPPQNMMPTDGKVLSETEVKQPVTFRWTPIVPKPQHDVVYKVRVFEVRKGQSASQAVKSNSPLLEKEVVNQPQLVAGNGNVIIVWPIAKDSKYGWYVEAMDNQGKSLGVSEAFSFGISNNENSDVINTQATCATPAINFPENGKAFNKDTKNIDIKGFINGEGKNVKLLLYKISDDPNVVDNLTQASKGQAFFSPLETFNYADAAKKINSTAKNYDVKTERSGNNSISFSASISTADLAHGSYYVIVQNGNCPSTPMAFSMSAGCGTNLSTVTINCKAWVNGFPTYTVSIVFNNIPPLPGGQNCSTVMNSILPVTGSISGLATLPVTIPSGGSAPAVTFTYTPATASQTTVNFNYFGIWMDGFSNTSNFGSGAVTLPSCVCNSCKDIQWTSGQQTVTVTGNNFNILQPINIAATGLGNIVAAKAEIIAFERYVGDSCVGCNKDYTQWGNFTSGTYGGNNGSLANATAPVSGSTTHSLYWNASAGASFPANNPFNLNITTPVLSNLTCCCDRVAVTIRYTFTFKNGNNGVCKMCSFVKRYEYKKGNCRNVVIDTPTDANPNPTK